MAPIHSPASTPLRRFGWEELWCHGRSVGTAFATISGAAATVVGLCLCWVYINFQAAQRNTNLHLGIILRRDIVLYTTSGLIGLCRSKPALWIGTRNSSSQCSNKSIASDSIKLPSPSTLRGPHSEPAAISEWSSIPYLGDGCGNWGGD